MIKPIVLVILDGWGIAPAWGGNAISIARTPFFDNAWSRYPRTELFASGEHVGLTGNEAGNSEVGHLNLGAGRLLKQSDKRINEEIASGSFYNNENILALVNHCKKNNSYLHLIGLMSNGRVHSDIDHLYALLEVAKTNGLNRVYIHIITDGRDVPPMSALVFLDELENKIKEIGVGKIASISGRYFAMDRDKRWDRTKLAYDAIIEGVAQTSKSPRLAVSSSYNNNHVDEFIIPTIIADEEKPYQGIAPNDGIMFFNYRADRARQLTNAIIVPDFKEFPKKQNLQNIFFVSMTPYEENYFDNNAKAAFSFEQNIKNTFSEVISLSGLKQLHIAETEKYAHVTYFFGGGNEKPFHGQVNKLIPSPKVPYYNSTPRMSADIITEFTLKNIEKFDFILINYANADMVGHTGDLQATVNACSAVDENLAKICQKVMLLNGCVIITADHGNAEQMLNQNTLEPYTEHTSNKVPFIIFSKNRYTITNNGHSLSSVSPTILNIMGINQPEEMNGESLTANINVKNE